MPNHTHRLARTRLIRLAIVASVVFSLVGGVITLYLINTAAQTFTDEERIALAKTAFEAEEYERVVEMLERPGNREVTIAAIQDDPESLRRYITARENVALPWAENLERTIGPLRQLVKLEPDNTEARDKLLNRFMALGQESEAVELAEVLTEVAGDDAALLRLLGTAQARLGQDKQALDSFWRAAELEPLDVATQDDVFELLTVLSRDKTPYVEQAKALFEAHPEDPRAEIIRALAYLFEDDVTRARSLLRQAADREPVDKQMVPHLVVWLDRVDLFAVSQGYLKRYADDDLDSVVSQEAVFRAFETGQYQEVQDRLQGLDAMTADADLVAVLALAYHESGSNEQAQKLISELDQRADKTAEAWAKLLPLMTGQYHPPGEMIDLLTGLMRADEDGDARDALADHPYLLQLLGEVRLSINEPAAAVGVFQRAAERRRPWARPHYFLARAYEQQGNHQAALDSAEQALLRQPNAQTAERHALALMNAADPGDPQAVEEAVERASHVGQELTNSQGLTLGAINLLARAGKTGQARQQAGDLLAQQTLSPELLQKLRAISLAYDLGFDDEISQALGAVPKPSPDAVADQARKLADAGNTQAARRFFEQAMPDEPDLQWEVAFASLLVSIQADDALARWIGLADSHPEQTRLQTLALNAPGARDNQAFAQRAIDRLRTQAGESSIAWRVEQARLNMRGNPSKEQLKTTSSLLQAAVRDAPLSYDAQYELTRCLLLLGDYLSADQSAKAAVTIAPSSAPARLLMGKTQHLLSRFEQAQVTLSELAHDRSAAPGLRYHASALLHDQGATRTAQSALTSLFRDGQAGPDAMLLLARLFISQGQYNEADAVCQRLLTRPTPQAISFLITYYERSGNQPLADQARRALDSPDFTQSDRLMARAQQAARTGQRKEALQLARQSAESDPTRPERWEQAIALAMDLAAPEPALQMAERGLEQAGESEGLRSLIRHRELVLQINKDRALVAIAKAVLSSSTNRGAAVKTLQLVKDNHEPATLAKQLTELAELTPRFQALHELAGDRLLGTRQYSRAYALASAGMARFVGSAACARISAIAALEMGQWPAAVSAAKTWSKRNPDDRARAELIKAAADIERRQFTAALETLQPYVRKQAATPLDAHLDLYTRALVLSGQSEDAWTILEPRLTNSLPARGIALRRIANDLPDASSATRWLTALQALPAESPQAGLERARAAFAAGIRHGDSGLARSAKQIISKSLPDREDETPEVIYLAAQIDMHLGDFTAAEKSLRRVLVALPNHPGVLNNFAVVLSELGGEHLDEAKQFAKQATRLAPDDPNLFDTLATVLLKRGEFDAALDAINRSIRMSPSDPAWRLTQADILDAMGQAEQANLLRVRYSASVETRD